MKTISTFFLLAIFIVQINAQINSTPDDYFPIQNFENPDFFHPDKFYSVKDDVLNLDSIIYYQFSSPVDSSPYEKEVYSYYTEQQIEKIVYSKWKQEDDDWEKEKKTEYVYDSEGRIISETTTVFSVASWHLGHKITTSYTSWGAVDGSQLLDWSMEENDWVLSRKIENIFDEYQRMSWSLHYFRDYYSGEMFNNRKYEYLYEKADNPDYIIAYYRNSDTEDRDFDWRYMITYDLEGNMLLFTTFEWNQTIQDWREYNKFESTYGDSSELLSQTGSEWDTINNQWFYTINYQHEYDDSINLIRSIEQIFDTLNDIWVNLWKEEVVYNPDWNINNISCFSWDSIPEIWAIDEGAYYHYSILGLLEIKSVENLVFPNPANDYIKISNEAGEEIIYELYSIDSKKITSSNSKDRTILIRTNALKPGTYILRIRNQDGETGKKIVVR